MRQMLIIGMLFIVLISVFIIYQGFERQTANVSQHDLPEAAVTPSTIQKVTAPTPEESVLPTLEQAQDMYQSADRELNKAYRKLRQHMSEQDFEDVLREQRRWLAYRDYHCEEVLKRELDFQSITDEQLHSKVHYWQRMQQITEERTTILQSLADPPDCEGSDWTGQWIDGYGGSLLILETDEGIVFEMEVVRGPTHHIGSIAGLAQTNRWLARFDDKRPGNSGMDSGPTWITFVRDMQTLQVFTANTRYYHGARAYFDGTYFRVGNLTKVDHQRLPKSAIEGFPLTYNK